MQLLQFFITSVLLEGSKVRSLHSYSLSLLNICSSHKHNNHKNKASLNIFCLFCFGYVLSGNHRLLPSHCGSVGENTVQPVLRVLSPGHTTHGSYHLLQGVFPHGVKRFLASNKVLGVCREKCAAVC